MSDAVAPPSRPLLVRRPGLLVVGVLGWVIGSWFIGLIGVFLLPVVLVAAAVLVPSGFTYGVVIRTMLVIRRRRARGDVDEASMPVPRFGPRLERVDRSLAVLLLVIAMLGAALWVSQSALDAAGYVSNNTTTLGNLVLAAGAFEFSLLVQLLVAIPVAAVLATRQVIDRGQLIAEAAELAHGGSTARRIRTTRVLSWLMYGLYSTAAVWSAVSFLQPSLL